MPGLYYSPIWEQYLYSFYLAIVTLCGIGFGCITRKNPTETAFVLSVQPFILMLYAYIFTEIFDIIDWFHRKKVRIRQTKNKLSKYLKRE